MPEIKWFVSADHVIRLYKRLNGGTWSRHVAAIDLDCYTMQYKAYVVIDDKVINNSVKFDDVPSAKHWVHTVLRMTL